MKDWFEGLEKRERIFVLCGGGAVVLALFYFLLLQPLYGGAATRAPRHGRGTVAARHATGSCAAGKTGSPSALPRESGASHDARPRQSPGR